MKSCAIMTIEHDPADLLKGERLNRSLHAEGFVVMASQQMRSLLGWTPDSWATFSAAWDNLGSDRFMADGGRYRSRRHATFAARNREAVRAAHQPHFQSRDYNPLNGDVQRWFEPIEPSSAGHPILRAIYRTFTPLFSALDGEAVDTVWHSEVHQFRIETSPAEIGRPTPEGLHRDGVDWVLVMLIARQNVAEGVTEIGAPDGTPLGRFTLVAPGDAVLLDDRRIMHGVTPIRAAQGKQPAYRDALVVTWRRDPARTGS
jgi:hypothetical protein